MSNPIYFIGPERAINQWRCTWPVAALAAAGHDAHAVSLDGEHEAFIPPGAVVVFHHTNQGDTFGPGFRSLAPFLEIVRREVKPSLLAVQWDDSYADLGDIQDVSGRGWYRALMEDVAASARAADRVIATTAYIEERMRGYGTPVVVVPNYIASWVCELDLPERLGSTAVWLGTIGGIGDAERGRRNSAHQHDWEWALRSPVPDGLPVRVVGVRSWQEHRWFQSRLGPGYTHRRATFDLEKLYRLVADACVGLAPVEPTLGFNRAKSWIKPLEYAALGLPSVAAPTDEYIRLNTDTLGAIEVATDPEDFWQVTALDVKGLAHGLRWEPYRTAIRDTLSVEANIGQWEKALAL